MTFGHIIDEKKALIDLLGFAAGKKSGAEHGQGGEGVKDAKIL